MKCNSCGLEYDIQVPSVINVSTNPELKEKVKNGEIFLSSCPSCQKTNLVSVEQLLYHDPDEHILIALSAQSLSSDGLPGYTCRQVSDLGSLIEKVKIFDAGLDDIAIELVKYVTVMELGKNANLKFFKLDGPDGEMIFTYPENNQMEMLSVGSNVYSDCMGIISRNPALREKAQGLVKVDSDWIAQFIA